MRRATRVGLSLAALFCWFVGCGASEERAGSTLDLAPPTRPSQLGPRAELIRSLQDRPGPSYEVRAAADGDDLISRAGPLRARFRARGTALVYLGPDTWTVTLDRWGRQGSERPAGEPSRITHEANAVRLTRPGLVEWFKSGPLGIEQGFVVQQPPSGTGRLSLRLRVAGDFQARQTAQSIVFASSAGESRLTYGDAFAYDATGQLLDVALTLQGGRVLITVDDAQATYPIVVDPLIAASETKLVRASGKDDEDAGNSVAIQGDTALLGAPLADVGGNGDQGKVYVFVRDGTSWKFQAELVVLDGVAGDHFGASVALDGDTAVVGAPLRSVGGNGDQGQAYVFTRTGTAWTQQAVLKASDGASDDEFGRSVGVDGDAAIVGAPQASVGASGNQGKAYIFGRQGSAWTQLTTLVGSDGVADDLFASAVAIDNGRALIGAPQGDLGGNADQGAAYVFRRPSTGTVWLEEAILRASDGKDVDLFGTDVALDGAMALIGAPFADIGAAVNQGKAYVFARSGAAWSQQGVLVGADGGQGDEFGRAVSIGGTLALVGARRARIGANTRQGAAYVFARGDGPAWLQQTKLVASDGASDDVFGTSVALSSRTALIGAPGTDIGGDVDQGAGYVVELRFDLGDPCLGAAECVSGHCADGVCCNSACGAGALTDCQACSAARGALADGTCGPVLLASAVVCRAAPAGSSCDAPEICNGVDLTCPADAVSSAGTVCRAELLGGCDVAEVCDGVSAVCPAQVVVAAGKICRAAVPGGCDVNEVCDGNSPACPANVVAAAGKVCRPEGPGDCDAQELCDGVNATCPADAVAPSTRICRPAAPGGCDVVESCDGATKVCPADAVATSSLVCRAAVAGGCDVEERCDGTSVTCPADTVVGANAVCRAAVPGGCDVQEVCDGTSPACPADAVVGAGSVCRSAAAGGCDVQEVCDGTAASCPADVGFPDTTPCTGGQCLNGQCQPVPDAGTDAAAGDAGTDAAAGDAGTDAAAGDAGADSAAADAGMPADGSVDAPDGGQAQGDAAVTLGDGGPGDPDGAVPSADAAIAEDASTPDASLGPVADAAPSNKRLTGGGFGCSLPPARRPEPAPVMLLLAVLILLGRRRRRRAPAGRGAIALLTSLALLGLAFPAQAQTSVDNVRFGLQRFLPAAGPNNLFVTEQGKTAPHLSPSVGFYLHFDRNPLLFGDDQLVSYQLNASLLAAFGLWDWLELGLALPLTLAQGSGDETSINISGGVGDLRLIAKARLLTRGKLTLGALLPVALPTGPTSDFLGNPGVVVTPTAVASLDLGAAQLALNGGVRLRSAPREYTVNPSETVVLGNEFVASSGARVRLGRTKIDAVIDFQLAVGLQESDAEEIWAELWGGFRFHLPGGFLANVGGGPGFGEGVGTPQFRLFAGLMYQYRKKKQPPQPKQLDSDGDGMLDDVDKCPHQPEDVDGDRDDDGCPEEPADTDGDGLIDAKDSCPNLPEDKDRFEDEDGCPDPDNDGDGVEDARDSCPNKPEDMDGFEDTNGCPDPDNDGDGVLDADDKCPKEQETHNGYQDADGCPDQLPKRVERFMGPIRGIYFQLAKSVIRRRSHRTLQRAARLLKRYPSLRLSIRGHTDSTGREERNQALSESRANAVRDYLVAQGIDASRLTTEGVASREPLASNKTSRGRAKNRRIEFKLTSAPPVVTGDADAAGSGEAEVDTPVVEE